MEKIVPNKNLSRRNSTGNFIIEHKVLSRYLGGSFASCHDNCKPHGLDQHIEPKSIPALERSDPTTTVEPPSSVQRIKKLFSSIPKPSPKDLKTTSNPSLLKYQVKQDAIESKRHDLKSRSKSIFKSNTKSKPLLHDPFLIPLDREAPRRRFSDIILPTIGLGDVLDHAPVVAGFIRTGKKHEKKIGSSRKDSKPAANPVKNTAKVSANGKNSRKVQALRTKFSSKPEGGDQDSRKPKPTKPVGENVQQKNLQAVPDETTKTQNPTSSKNDEEASAHGHNGAKDEKKGVAAALGVKNVIEKPIRVAKISHNESQISSPLKKGETPRSESENKGVASDLGVKNATEKMEISQNGAQISSPAKKDETPRSKNENKGVADALGLKNTENPTRVGDSSPPKLKFSQGKIIDNPESGGPRKLKFGQGKVLGEGQNSQDDKFSLRRLASDGELHSPERHSVNVVLKRHNLDVTKPNLGLHNNVIEETASKLMQTRKSKVKALVGAFETISSNDMI